MAQTNFASSDAMTVKHWAARLGYDIVYRTDLSPLIGASPNSIIQLKTETQKEPGDQITFALMKKLTGAGFSEGQVAEGNGESLSIYSESVLINELGHVVEIPNNGRAIDAQRVPIPLREAAMHGLKTWKSERMSKTFFYHVCGWTPANSLGSKYIGNNTVVAPSSGRHLWVGSSAYNSDDDLTSADTFDLRYVDYAAEMAKSATSPVRPINISGNEEAGGRDIEGGKYVMYLHPYQVTDLRTNTSDGQWLDIQKAAMNAGEVSKNPIFTGALGMYNNVILKESLQVTTGVDADGTDETDVRRAVLLGAQAASVAFGKANGPTTYAWNEELIDHKRRLEVSTFTIWGLTKNQYDSTDFGTVVVSSYAAAHTA